MELLSRNNHHLHRHHSSSSPSHSSSVVAALISNLTQHQFLYNITAKCQDVNRLSTISEQCQFVQTVDDCLNDDNLFSYIQFAYCHIGSQIVGTILLLVWLLFLFVAIGITADDFLCPLLITIAKSLKLSDNIAGVTFLAFGNGAPDIFSSIIGIGQHDSSLIIGELYGAGIFVTTVVVGSILVQNQFQIMKRPLLRDISFYLATTTLVWSIFFSGEIRLYNSLLYIGIYLVYVTVVIVSGYIYRRNQEKRDLNETRTAQKQMFAKFHMPGEKPTNSPTKYKVNEFDDQKRSIKEGLKAKISLKNYLASPNGDNYEGVVLRRIKYRQYCHNPLHQRRFTIYNISDSLGLTFGGNVSAVDPPLPFHPSHPIRRLSKQDSEICAVAESNPNCQLASSVFAINFDDNNKRNNQCKHQNGDCCHQLHQLPTIDHSVIGHNDRRPTLSDIGFKIIPLSKRLNILQNTTTTTANTLSTTKKDLPNYSLMNCFEYLRQFLVRKFSPTTNDDNKGNNSSHGCTNCNHYNKSMMVAGELEINNNNNHPNQFSRINLDDKDANNNSCSAIGGCCANDSFDPIAKPNQEGEFIKKLRKHKKLRFRKKAKSFCNFCLESSNIELKEFWESNLLSKLLMLIKAPVYFGLTLSIPVVDLDMPLNGWYKSLILVQILVSPQICLILTGLSVNKLKYHLISFVCSVILIPVVACTSEKNKQPVYHTLLAYIGFGIAVIVIYTIANEVVDLLTTLGIMFNISNFILGITVLAWGNSIGDFISNMSMAKNGFPRMAISACFGGPVLNMLLGIGIPYTVLLVKNDLGSIHLHYSNMITVLYTTITTSLLTTVIILVFITHFKSTRYHGFVLYGLYVCFLCASICAELKMF